MIGDGGLFPEGWDTTRDVLVIVGHGAEALIGRFADAGQQRLFLYTSESAGTGGLPRRVRVARAPIELFDAILSLRAPLPKRVVVHRQTDPWVTEEIHSEVTRTVDEALRSKRLQAAASEELGPARLLQGIEALPEVAGHASIAALDRAFVKRPCFIVSPGPSLERNVAQLRKVKGRALLMTCTQALRALQAFDVVPDLVVVASAGPDRRRYAGLDTSAVEALVIGAACPRSHWQRPARRHLAFAESGELDQWVFEPFGEDAALRTGGSVACSELSLALRFGCDPIVFVGQDLAFTDGRAYSPASSDGDARIKASADGHSFILVKPPGSAGPGAPDADGDLQLSAPEQLVKVPGYQGGLVLTSGSFYTYLVWFETMARSLEGRVMLVNSTEGGANIRGMQHRPLADAISAYVHDAVPVGEVLDARTRSIDLGARRARARGSAERIQADLGHCLGLATRCRQLAQEARRDPARLERLQETEAELSQALHPLRFLSLLTQGEIAAAQERVLAAASIEENLAAADGLFHVVERACRTLGEPLERALAELP